MDLSFLKNPVILSLLAIIITCLYLEWEKNNHPNQEKVKINYTKPIIIGIIVFIISYGLFGINTNNIDTNIYQTSKLIKQSEFINNKLLSEKLIDSFGSNTYHLVGKNSIKIPQVDVFIDMARF